MKEIKIFERAMIALPIFSTLWFYSLVIFYRIYDGCWPYFNSPSTIRVHGLQFVYELGAGLILLSTIYSPLIVIPVQVIRVLIFKHKIKEWTLVYSVVWLIWIGSIYIDPGSFYEWYFD